MTGLERINDTYLKLPVSFKRGMNVPGIIYASRGLQRYIDSASIEQVANVASLPGIIERSIAMPDIHSGYGFPIGGVAAFDLSDGVISPGGVGYDINCGVRLIRSNLQRGEIEGRLRDVAAALYNEIPAGLSSSGKLRLGRSDIAEILTKGAVWAVERGMGTSEDLRHTESGGCMETDNPDAVSDRAIERGLTQVATLGSGNHFIEIQHVEEIYDVDIAERFGLFAGQVTVMIHSGSRGLGHQVCADYLSVMERSSKRHGIVLHDKELACAPFKSREGGEYFSAMKAAANYAWANRQCMMHFICDRLCRALSLSPKAAGFGLVYDVAHNIAKVERHKTGGRERDVLVHRKGATRAYPAGHPELPEVYRNVGQPVLIPGDMGRASYVMVGLDKGMEETFGSSCHGAGRILSRHSAIKKASGRAIWRELEDSGIIVMAAGRKTLAEEMPEAYKDVSEVVNVVKDAGICKNVARLKPLSVIKG